MAEQKKLLIIYILEILKKHSDENHRLRQQDIIDLLYDEYGFEAERKAVSRNLEMLNDTGLYDIEKNGGYCLIHDFDDTEIRLLISSLIFSKNIPSGMSEHLIKKLCSLSSKYFSSGYTNIKSLKSDTVENRQLFYTLETLNNAVSSKKKVSFNYCSVGPDKKLHKRLSGDGTPKLYTVTPIRVVAANGRFYIICNNDKYDDLSYYRLDRIRDITMLKAAARPHREINGLEQGLNLPKHLAEHIYMFTGESVTVIFRVNNQAINDVTDWFGTDIKITNTTELTSDITVTVNAMAMKYWALQYLEQAEVLSPSSLRKEIRKALAEGLKKYSV